ncbi:MAG: DUF2326 domain-containing protein [Firmicutes bacterium]|nr:DUF2326 domain-containing protein [Bacillota bacterium]
MLLLEIQCDKFKSKGSPRGAIKFHEGLNVVQGHSTGDNSIGKSTFLLIVDFVFGGNDYVKDKSIVGKIGHHTIQFCFLFNDVQHHFSRSTDNSNKVDVCNENYETQETIDIEDFCIRLKSHYSIDLPDITFREIISRYFRIYNRETSNEKAPLSGFSGDKDKNALVKFFQLNNAYTTLKEHAENLKKKDEYKTAIKAAGKEKVVVVPSKTIFAQNEEQLSALEVKLESIAQHGKDDLLNRTDEEIQKAAELRGEYDSLVSKRKRLWSQWWVVKNAADSRQPATTEDFEELQQFFPDCTINVDNLKRIESFHSKLSTILQNEFTASMSSIREVIDEADAEIARVEDAMRTLELGGRSRATLESYASVKLQINNLRAQNDLYESLTAVSAEIKILEATYSKLFMEQASLIENKINPLIAKLNADIYGADEPPQLIIASPKSYTYATPSDRGTATNWKNLIFLDMALLELTPLPAIAHDTIAFVHTDTEDMSRILEKYALFKKQIFVAFDKTKNYKGNAQTIIDNNTVLTLADGDELFGESWKKSFSKAE